jgi:hypothetical protein
MIRHGILTIFIGSAVLWACQEPLDPASSISKFRVLAVQAEPPEVRPGEQVTHRALTADPEGKDREISYLWLTCLGLMTPNTGASGCTIPLYLQTAIGSYAFRVNLQTYPVMPEPVPNTDVYTVSVPLNALDQMPEEDTYMQATTIVVLCAGGTVMDEDQMASIMDKGNLTEINFDDLCKDGDGLVSFKTFRISEADNANRNTNPTIKTLEFNHNKLLPLNQSNLEPSDTTLSVDDNSSKCKDSECIGGTISKPNTFVCDTLSDCLDGVDIDVDLTNGETNGDTDDSFQFYDDVVLGETKSVDEAPYISWFADGGELSRERSRTKEPPGPFTVRWSPPQKGGDFTLYVVAHDLRGGTSWKTYSIAAVTAETK